MPYFSVLVPVFRTEQRYLVDMINSVRGQTDPDWELILVDDGSDDARVSADLKRSAASDGRIRVETLPTNCGISAASARALSLAGGEFVCLLDHDDLLVPTALSVVRSAIVAEPESDLLYSDETIVGPEGEVLEEFVKPDFSPERLRGQMYTGHLSVLRRSFLVDIGGFRPGFDGSQDYDVILRAGERARKVFHIREPLYQWRILPESVSHSAGNDKVFDAARRALTDHLARRGTGGTVIQTDPTGRYRIARDVPVGARVRVLSDLESPGAAMAAIGDLDCDFLVFLAPDVAPTTGSVDRLVAAAADPQIGPAVPRTIDRTGRLLSAGLAMVNGQMVAIGAGQSVEDHGPFGALLVNREVTCATSDAFAVATDLFAEVGGLSTAMSMEWAVVDLAFKCTAKGRPAVVVADADVVLDAPPRLPGPIPDRPFVARWGQPSARDRYWPAVGQ